ncbi:ATP-dependent helicase [Marinobacter sp. R17]|uniref:UvrD-helicase domain-containing protein n=1 Tax=Marinobacter sp. R17 TaxID=2484250 RepID=UPI000F4B548B|nr:UvrD-helicase domain-containing protein [Marinobacter sp. R17]ROT93558.1 ATP-dependent helicase [Marinobacter sp. R17]
MRCLKNVKPTPEQLKIVSRNRPGVEVIRGAAGSGKTTTAILRLNSLVEFVKSRRTRTGNTDPVRILLLTYNRTLRGYVNELVEDQVAREKKVEFTINTFSKWAVDLTGHKHIVPHGRRATIIESLGKKLNYPLDFLISEVEYLMGRFSPDNLDEYLTARRDGRGTTPRVEKAQRHTILEEVVKPYQDWLSSNNLIDWNDLALAAINNVQSQKYDIVIVDEAQDFSANQIRAITQHIADVSFLTFVLDTVQRIYARGYTWAETGLTIRPENSWRLGRNYRNTKQIAQFAAALVQQIPVDDDSTLPDFEASERDGKLPQVLKGKFSDQLNYAIAEIQKNVDLDSESVAFLHPLGWFNHTNPDFS